MAEYRITYWREIPSMVTAREGDATSHYRFQVNQQQYTRFTEGTHVQLFLENNNLRDIRRIP